MPRPVAAVATLATPLWLGGLGARVARWTAPGGWLAGRLRFVRKLGGPDVRCREAKRGYHGYALDLPGHSRSYPVDWEPHRTINQHAEYVHRFAQTVCGGEKPVMIGCSIGGCIGRCG